MFFFFPLGVYNGGLLSELLSACAFYFPAPMFFGRYFSCLFGRGGDGGRLCTLLSRDCPVAIIWQWAVGRRWTGAMKERGCS